jgi:hypothetical protein
MRGILDSAEHQKILDKLCSPGAAPPAPAPAPAPAPPPTPVALPPPAYQQPHTYPGWAPPFAQPPMGMAYHAPPPAAPPYVIPVPPAQPPPYAPPAAATPRGPERTMFVGKIVSPLICGNNLASPSWGPLASASVPSPGPSQVGSITHSSVRCAFTN